MIHHFMPRQLVRHLFDGRSNWISFRARGELYPSSMKTRFESCRSILTEFYMRSNLKAWLSYLLLSINGNISKKTIFHGSE